MRENHYAILVQCLEFPTFSTYKRAYRFLFFVCFGHELPQSKCKVIHFLLQYHITEEFSLLGN